MPILGFDSLKAAVELELDASASLELSATAQVDSAAALTDGHEGQWRGCVNVTSGFDINAKADAEFFHMFEKDVAHTLYGNTWPLYDACTGESTPQRRAYIDAGAEVMSSYPDRILRKFAKHRGAAHALSTTTGSYGASQKDKNTTSCLASGPGPLVPILQNAINGSRYVH